MNSKMGSESELIFPEESGNLVESDTKLKSNGFYHVKDVNEQLSEEIEIGSSSPAVTKSTGLKKWRRRPRDLVKKTGSSLTSRENGITTVSPVHKPAVHVNGGSSVQPISGGSFSYAANNLNEVKSVLPDDQQRNGGNGPGKKARGFKMDNENLNRVMGSDSGSSNFVFVQGKQNGVFEKYDEEASDDADNKHLKSDDESDDVSLVADNNGEHEGLEDKDYLVESVKGLHFAQLEFEREVQKWKDVMKDDPLIFDDPFHETLELKDAKILELESILNSGDFKSKLEDQLMKLIQMEVEFVVLTTTNKLLIEGPLQEIKQDDLQKKKDDKLQTKEDLKKVQNRVCKFTTCFIIMLILLVVTLYLQFAPQNVEVIPT